MTVCGEDDFEEMTLMLFAIFSSYRYGANASEAELRRPLKMKKVITNTPCAVQFAQLLFIGNKKHCLLRIHLALLKKNFRRCFKIYSEKGAVTGP